MLKIDNENYYKEVIIEIIKKRNINKNLKALNKYFKIYNIDAEIRPMKAIKMYTLKFCKKQYIFENVKELIDLMK